MGFWYQFRFRSPARLEVDEKRASSHGVAGITEGDSYCAASETGDRALSLFFKAWGATEKPTYEFCSYDLSRGSASEC